MDMSRDEFRQYGHQLVDWMADYVENLRDLPVLPSIQPGTLMAQLPGAAPDEGEPMDRIIADFEKLIVPANTQWNHPRFFSYFSVSASRPGILAEMLISTLNVNGMLWRSSPAATELEQVTMSWLRQWIGLGEDYFGLIHDTASLSSMHALAAARQQAAPEIRVEGGSHDLTVYISEQTHSSVEKGAITLGLGQANVRRIPVDEQFAMRADLLEEAIQRDLAAGKRPCCITATIGTTATTAIDPVNAIADIAERHRIWLHVDAAYAGPCAMLPEMANRFAGINRADSLVMNPHKWMGVPIDLSALYTRKPEVMRQAFSLVPEYLKTSDGAMNLMDYSVALGRRFRSIKLFFVMRYFGKEAMMAMLRDHCRWATGLGEKVAAHPRFELFTPVNFSLVCMRYRGADEENRAICDRVNESGVAFLTPTVLRGRTVIRLPIGNLRTTEEDVLRTWEAIQEAAESVERAPAGATGTIDRTG